MYKYMYVVSIIAKKNLKLRIEKYTIQEHTRLQNQDKLL